MRRDSRLSGILHILLHMAEEAKPITSEVLATAMQTNPAVVRRVMAGLREAGFVRSERGHGGGWTIARTLHEITLRDIYTALGSPELFAMGNRTEAPGCLVEQAVNAALEETFREAEALLIAAHPDHAENIRAFRRHWREMVPHPIEGTVALFEGLIDAGHDVTMLTNFAADTFSEAREMFPFLNRPRGVTVSGEIGLIKPDKAIYDRHAGDFGLDPAATVFIDDTLVNVEGATAAGWAEALHFTGPEKLRTELLALGLIG